MVDYVITLQYDVPDVLHTRKLRGASSLNLTEHRLIRSKMSLVDKKSVPYKTNVSVKKLNTNKEN